MSEIEDDEDLAWIGIHESGIIPPLDAIKSYSKSGLMTEVLKQYGQSKVPGVEVTRRFSISNTKSFELKKYYRILDSMRQRGIRLIRYIDREYPERLRHLSDKQDPPLLLYYKGNIKGFEKCVAVVGTRNCSHKGYEMARSISKQLARRGYKIVSGLARGIDSSAHHGALIVNGITIAILPWMEEPYPPENSKLLEDIMIKGAKISDRFLQETSPERYRFVDRNRIISGISDFVIAVESGDTGGTPWQVDIALKQGKVVFAVKPDPDNMVAVRGFRQFIKKGAIEVNSVEDIIDKIGSEKQPRKDRGLTEEW